MGERGFGGPPANTICGGACLLAIHSPVGGNEPGNDLPVASNNDLLARLNTIQERPQRIFGLERTNF